MTRRSALLYAAFALACQKQEAAPAPAPSADAKVAAAPSASAAKPKPWFAGTWAGAYAAERFSIELPVGKVPAWGKDDGTRAAGAGKINVQVSPEGVANGSAEGPLGKQVVRGTADDKALNLELVPETATADAFRGVLLAERAGESAKGELRASSGDSLTVRKASVTLAKQP